MTSRPVLMPGGWPPEERERDACARVLLFFNGDLSRVFDAPALDAKAYAEHIARISYFESQDALPLVFITGRLASPRPLLVLHSQVHERARMLDNASWVVCVAPGLMSDFIRDAAESARIEPVGRGLCAWHVSPRPMLVASWAVGSHEVASALTSLGLAPESGFIASVGPNDDLDAGFGAGVSVGLDSLNRMRAAQEETNRVSGARGKVALRPNPRLRRNG